jgi:magnesium chelatase subunit D
LDTLTEYAALRTPWQQRSRHRARRGAIVGTEPTRSLTDVALVATALEAAKFQPIRRAATSADYNHLLIRPSDLRRNRREPQPDTVMVLVLDHTCRQGWNWSDALAPYLRWAYTQRAALTLIELGHRDNADELRAERYRASSVLDDRVAGALDQARGRATPLAYALDLAVQELRRRLRYGQAGVEHAWLVVASDGRGNVPLDASLRRELAGPVGRDGTTDAIAAAAAVRSLPDVQAVVLAPPGLTHYAHLPFELAAAMGGIVAEPERSP